MRILIISGEEMHTTSRLKKRSQKFVKNFKALFDPALGTGKDE